MNMTMSVAKWSLFLILIAALVAGGVLAGVPQGAQAASKITYNVVLMDTATAHDVNDPGKNNESPWCLWSSNANAAASETVVAQEGTTFQMVVDGKLTTDTKTGESYYIVTIPKKSFKSPIFNSISVAGKMKYKGQLKLLSMVKDAKGKLYPNGGPGIDVHTQLGASGKPVVTIGGNSSPAGSLIIDIIFAEEANTVGTIWLTQKKYTHTFTTGQSSAAVKGTKYGTEGYVVPDADYYNVLSKPLVGKSIDLNAGTGTLVTSTTYPRWKHSALGFFDVVAAKVWTMKITPVGKK